MAFGTPCSRGGLNAASCLFGGRGFQFRCANTFCTRGGREAFASSVLGLRPTSAPWSCGCLASAVRPSRRSVPFLGGGPTERSFASATPDESVPIQVEETPNPQTLKFSPLVSRPLVNARGVCRSRHYSREAEEVESPLAAEVLKSLSSQLASAALAAQKDLADEATSAASASSGVACDGSATSSAQEPPDPETEELVQSIKEALETRIRPYLQVRQGIHWQRGSAAPPFLLHSEALCQVRHSQSDGGDLEFMGFDAEKGLVYVHLVGSCQGCPSSTVTVKRGMKQMLQYYFPEVEDVVQCDENGEPLEEAEE